MRRPGLEIRFRFVITRSRLRPYFSSTTSVSNGSPSRRSVRKSRMYPSSLSRRAMSSFRREVGIAAVSWSALLAFRIRVSMSAMGSVSIVFLLPGALGHPGDHALVGELPQADPAEPELLEDRAGAAAPVAARVLPRLELLRPGRLRDHRLLRHYSESLLSPANGRPRPVSSARALSSSAAVVVIAMSRPRTFAIWS